MAMLHDIRDVPDGADPPEPVAVVEGGVPLWKRRGRPAEQPERA